MNLKSIFGKFGMAVAVGAVVLTATPSAIADTIHTPTPAQAVARAAALPDWDLGEDDPTAFFYKGRPYRVRAEQGGHVLEVALPFTSREDVSIQRDGDELQLQVDGLRRTIVLPRALMDVPTTSAKMDDGVLRIRFEGRAEARKK